MLYLGLYIDMVETRANKRASESCQNAGDKLTVVNRIQLAPPSEIIKGKESNQAATICSALSTEYFMRTYSRRHSKSSIDHNTKLKTSLE